MTKYDLFLHFLAAIWFINVPSAKSFCLILLLNLGDLNPCQRLK